MKQIENNPQGQARFQFNAKLLNIGSTILQNANGKNFKIASVEFADVNGEIQTSSAAVYEGNYNHESLKGKGLEIGKSYLTTATIVGEQVFLQMSHLESGASRASVSMFLATATTPATVTVGELTN